MKDGFEFTENRFFIRGKGDISYNYNHGRLASDPRLAATNFLNALDSMQPLLDKYKTENEKLLADVPTLKDIVDATWKKRGRTPQPQRRTHRHGAQNRRIPQSRPTGTGGHPTNPEEGDENVTGSSALAAITIFCDFTCFSQNWRLSLS